MQDVFLLLIRRFPDLCKNTSFFYIFFLQERHHSIEPSLFHQSLIHWVHSLLQLFLYMCRPDREVCLHNQNNMLENTTKIPCQCNKGFSRSRRNRIPSNTLIDALVMFVCKLYDPRTSNKYSRSEVEDMFSLTD